MSPSRVSAIRVGNFPTSGLSRRLLIGLVILVAVFAVGLAGSPQPRADTPTAGTSEPLPSWNDSPTKSAIIDFVSRVTDPSSIEFVPESERIAVFDHDGTLWSERPIYFQQYFVFDRIRQLAPQHPDWHSTQPFQAVLENDMDRLAGLGHQGLIELLSATLNGNTTEDVAAIMRDWLSSARHPTLDRPYTELVFQPMLELLEYLRANGFLTFICTGGNVDFVRVFAEEVYGIPPQQVIGSMGAISFEIQDGTPVLELDSEVWFINDGEGKPVGIHRHIGQRPIAAFGNSDGDLQMLQWTTAGDGARLGVIVHHTDSVREWAYDRESPVGHLEHALDQAGEEGWNVISMKDDWSSIYPE